ncbi:hypothetical protein ABPG74_011387 [Tetrahymena malaccensis]
MSPSVKQIVLFCALLSLICCAPKWNQLKNYTFDQYVTDFSKGYAPNSSEYHMRKTIFNKKLQAIISFNSQSGTYKKGVNQFTDQSEQELENQTHGYVSSGLKSSFTSQSRLLSSTLSNVTLQDLPASVDWREKDVVTPVKDQGKCGSCWAFASAATIESHAAIASGKLKTLSTQQLVSCAQNSYNCGGVGGCHGSIAELAFSYVQLFGLTSDYKYSYSSYQGVEEGSCSFNPDKQSVEVMLDGYLKLTSNSYEDIMVALATVGPLAVAVDASKWHDYEGGVFDGCDYTANMNVNHAVVLVGYGTDEVEGDYWLVRNSWGTKFGENGYIRLRRESQTKCGVDYTPLKGQACKGQEAPTRVCGQCAILYDASYPLNVRVVG